MADSKLFLGPRLRRLRRDRGLSQTDMAASLAISPSYLNHLERNQRPVTAALLLRLAEHYEIDVRTFAATGGARTGADDLAEIFSDAILSDLGVPRYELAEIAHNAPVGRRRDRAALRRAEGSRPQPLAGAAMATRARWSRPRIGCATISSSTATISPSSSNAPRRWAARSPIRCR